MTEVIDSSYHIDSHLESLLSNSMNSRNKYKIVGFNVHHYISHMLTHDKNYIIYGINKQGNKIEITFGNNILEIKNIEEYKLITMIPKKNIVIDLLMLYNQQFRMNQYDKFIKNIHNFTKTEKYMDKRPVWIFGGSYQKGIEHFRKYINTFSIEENGILPDMIACNTIIIPNNSNVTVNKIKERCIGDNEYIFVGFEKIRTDKTFFSKIHRHKYVYIFTGEHNLGKHYIAQYFHTKTVYEAKYLYFLPSEMNHNIVIINSDSFISCENIINRYNNDNYVFISVHFSRI